MQDITGSSGAVAAGSAMLHAAFIGITALLGVLFIAAVYASSAKLDADRAVATRRTSMAAVFTVAWIAFTAFAGQRGVLSFEGRPPTMVLMLALNELMASATESARATESSVAACMSGFSPAMI